MTKKSLQRFRSIKLTDTDYALLQTSAAAQDITVNELLSRLAKIPPGKQPSATKRNTTMTDANWTDRKHLNTALKAALEAIPLDCNGPLVDQLVDQLLELKAANKAAARANGRPVLVQS